MTTAGNKAEIARLRRILAARKPDRPGHKSGKDVIERRIAELNDAPAGG